MIKQIFSRLGRKKNNSSTTQGGVDIDSLPQTETDDNNASVVPLRTGPAPIVNKKKDSAEVFQEAVDKLVDKLEGINENLGAQIQQNEQLVEKMDALPAMLTPLPEAVEQQRAAFAQVAEQLRGKVARDEKVAEELCGIHEKVAASAEVDAKMCESFSQFSETLGKLDADTVSQTEWIQQMSRTFSASERYIKYTLARQQVRFFWIFGISLGICLLAIVGLIVGIVLLGGA